MARCRLARNPKLRIRTKPRGSRWSRNRRRNSSTSRVMSLFLLPWAESRHWKVTLPAERATSLLVGDGDAMGVGAEIAQHMFRSSEGSLGVDDPVMAEQDPQPGCEGTWLSEWGEVAVELERASMESSCESGDELAAEDTAEHADGQKEGVPGGDPAGVIRRETTGGQDAVDMRMKLQALIPAVEHAEEAYLGPKMPRIASDLQQGLGAGVKEQVVNQPLVLQGERG